MPLHIVLHLNMRSLRYYIKLCLLVILSGQQVQTIHLLDTQHMIMQTVQTRKDILIKQSKSGRKHVRNRLTLGASKDHAGP
jgi:hypothetical protein